MLSNILAGLTARLERTRTKRRWAVLQRAGLRIGKDVRLPSSTWIDSSHCYLVSIGDRCVLGEQCLLLAHDAQMDEFLDAARLGRVVIREDSHIGHRTTVLPGVEIGPRTIVLPNSVVMKSLPSDTICAGNPAKVVSTLEEYLAKCRSEQEDLPTFDEMEFDALSESEGGRARLRSELASGGYVRTRR